MKGTIKKIYRGYGISYTKSSKSGEEASGSYMVVDGEDMEEFMDDIDEKWSEILTDKLVKLCKSVMKEENKKGKQEK